MSHYRGAVCINTHNLANNFALLMQEKPQNLRICAVVKDNALGHGLLTVSKEALSAGCDYLAVACMEEAIILRKTFSTAPILLFGERSKEDLLFCIQENITIQIQSLFIAKELSKLAIEHQKQAKIHIKIDTGMGRYGFIWRTALSFIEEILLLPGLYIEGLMTHFAQSDELDKTYAKKQWSRFNEVLIRLTKKNKCPSYIHACNTGGYLDLSFAHGSMVRLGIFSTGIYPSATCRRVNINGKTLLPVMSVVSKIAFIKELEKGDYVGYGMHFQASKPCKIAVLPIGYGDGYPRLRNVGEVLICGKKAPICGGNAMDATMVNITQIPEATLGEPVTLLGEQDKSSITVRDVAQWTKTVPYAIMTAFDSRKLTYQIF